MRNKITLLIGLLVLAFTVNAQKSKTPVKLDGLVSNTTPYVVENNKAIAEDFEGSFLPFGWSETANERTWGRSTNPTFQINGYSALIGQDIDSPEEMLITPPLTLDGTVTEFSFHAAGVNNTFGFGSSTILLKYKLLEDATWTDLGDTLDLADGEGDTLLTYDISTLPAGDYYFAFATESSFNYGGGFTSYALIDDVAGPDMSTDIKTITINITNSQDARPVENVKFTFGDQMRYTDETGTALFGVLDGTYDWGGTVYGYADISGTGVVVDADATIDLTMDPMPVVHFTVDDGTDPLEGVNINIDGEDIVTDTSGMAWISLGDGTFPYTASMAGYEDATGDATLAGIGDTAFVDVTMVALPTYTVTFNVTDGTNALEGVSIDIAGQILTTDVAGAATIDLYDEEWPWVATLDGYFEAMDTVTVAGGVETVDVTLEVMPSGIIWYADDFESYTDGDYLAVANSTNWMTWSDDPGGAEDGVISTNFSASGNNAAFIATGNDMVLKLGNQTSGKYIISYYMLMESGNEGYYNVQQTEVPGTKWMYDVYFDGDGTGRLSIDQTDTATFVYPEAKWFLVSQIIDLDNDMASLEIDGEWVLSWMYSQDGDPANLQLGGVNFYGADNVNYYLDNVEYKQIIFTDDFESYAVGDLVAENSDIWETWSGAAGGGGDDAAVTDAYAKSAVKSMAIGDGGADDMILPLGDLTEGKYHVGFDVLVESGGFEGYYNFQKYEAPGTEWAFDVYFYTDGTGAIDVAGSEVPFNYNQDEFNSMEHFFDLDNDTAFFYVNGSLIHSWKYSLDQDGAASVAQLGGIDFYAWADAGTGQSYFDDVVFGPYEFLPIEITGSDVTFTITDMLSTDPIEGATIQINGQELTTDVAGMATIVLFDGSYNYTVMATDYLTIEGTAVVDGAALPIALEMEPLYDVTFNIDMSEMDFDPATQRLFITGATADGTAGIGVDHIAWPNPQQELDFELEDPEEDMTYSVTVMGVRSGDYEYKYGFTTNNIPVWTEQYPEDVFTFTVGTEDIVINDMWEVGLEDTDVLADFNIYPNPTNGIVTVGTSQQVEVTITNAIGQVIVNKVVGNNETLDLSSQTQGLYFISAKTKDAVKTLRLIVE